MNERYKNEMSRFFSDQNIMNHWLKVEIAIIAAKIKDPAKCSDDLKNAILILEKIVQVDVARAKEIEKETNHDLNAFVRAVAEQMAAIAREMGLDPTLGRLLHQGVTSYDIEDTAQSMLLYAAGQMLIEKLEELRAAAHEKAAVFKYAPANGYTHNQIAEPVTIGKRFLDFERSIKAQMDRFHEEIKGVNLCKIKGAVGVYGGALSPEFEANVANMLDMWISKTATQILPIENLLQFFNPLLIIASFVENFTQNLRLASGDLAEIKEGFAKKQTGSSTMTFKENPINLENVTGAARTIKTLYAGLAGAAATWRERDISNSFQVQRHIIPEIFETMWHIAGKLTAVLNDLRVFPIQSLRNINKYGDFIFAGAAKDFLADNLPGSNEEIYNLVKKHSMDAKNSADFKGEPLSLYDALADELEKRITITDHKELVLGGLKTALSLPYNLRNIDGYYDGEQSVYEYSARSGKNIHDAIVDYIADSGQLEKFSAEDSLDWINTYEKIVVENHKCRVPESPAAFPDLRDAVVKFCQRIPSR